MMKDLFLSMALNQIPLNFLLPLVQYKEYLLYAYQLYPKNDRHQGRWVFLQTLLKLLLHTKDRNKYNCARLSIRYLPYKKIFVPACIETHLQKCKWSIAYSLHWNEQLLLAYRYCLMYIK